MSIRPLSNELQEKAKKELGEDPKRLQDDVKYIKDWLRQQKYITARTEDQWILAFLRGCKFSLERTKEKMDMYYALRGVLPEFFANRDPYDAKIQELLTLGSFVPTLKYENPTAPICFMIKSTAFDPSKHTVGDLFKVNMMFNDLLMVEDDQMLICGVRVIVDMGGMTTSQMMAFTPAILKKIVTCFEEAYPTRPKEIHFWKIPSFFESLFNIVKPFMKEKMLKRIFVHKKNDLKSLHKHFSKAVLPTEYGGDAGPMRDMIDYWKQRMENHGAWFKEDANYKTDETLRPGKPKTSSSLFGIEGSFRKLNVD